MRRHDEVSGWGVLVGLVIMLGLALFYGWVVYGDPRCGVAECRIETR